MELILGGQALETNRGGKIVCAVDQSNLHYLNERTYSHYYLEGCVEVREEGGPTVRSEIGDSYSYKVLNADEMARRLKINAPYHRNHPVARIKEDLLRTVANQLRIRTEYLPEKKVEFFLISAGDGERICAALEEGVIKLFRWAN